MNGPVSKLETRAIREERVRMKIEEMGLDNAAAWICDLQDQLDRRVSGRQSARFVKRLHESVDTVWKVAQWLTGKGFSVQVPPTQHGDSLESWEEFSDSGDLWLLRGIEVKRLKARFTRKEDWPFGKYFIVTDVRGYQRYEVKPVCWVIVSACGKHYAVVKAESFKRWKSYPRTDRETGHTKEYYFAPLDDVRFGSFEDEGYVEI